MSNRNNLKRFNKQPVTSPWYMLPFILTLTIIPFVLGLYSFDAELGTYYWQSTGVSSSSDLFLHYKSLWLVIMGVIMAITFAFGRFSSGRAFSFGIAMIPLYVYLGCIVLSTIFSTNIERSLFGIQHHFESAFVLLTYCMLVLYGTYFVDNDRNLNWFINGFFIGVACLVLFGLFQYSSGIFKSLYDNGTLSTDSSIYELLCDFFGCENGMPWYEKLEPFKTQTMADYVFMPTGGPTGSLSLNFPLGQVYLTLYNPNYIAYFTTLTAPFFITLSFFQNKLWKKILFIIVGLGSILCLIGSQSLAGFLSLGVSAIILIVAFRKKIFKSWIPWVCTLGALVVALVGLDFITNHSIYNKLTYMGDKIANSFESGFHNEEFCGLENLTSTEKGLRIEYSGQVAYMVMEDTTSAGVTIRFTDESGKELDYETRTNSNGKNEVVLTEQAFLDASVCTISDYPISVTYDSIFPGSTWFPYCSVRIDQKTWTISNQMHTECYYYIYNESNPAKSFGVLTKGTDEEIGTYYYTVNYSHQQAVNWLYSHLNTPEKLQACFEQLATVEPAYKNQWAVYSTQADPCSSYLTYLTADTQNMYTFFYYLSQSSPKDDAYYIYNQVGKWTQIPEKPATFMFTDYPRFASGRGYIWARSIPIMFNSAKNFFIGTGPDTYVINFPHYDYVDSFRCDYAGKVITKPHSLYLQIGVQTGFVSLLAVLALYAMYLISCLKLYWKSSFTSLYSKVSIAILASITGYMVSGITNDSTVSYSYVFWAMLGVGFAVNRLEKKALKEQEEALERERLLEEKRKIRAERKKEKQNAH